MQLLKNVLWATDFSNEAKSALLYADLLARKFEARLTALHVIPDFSPLLYDLSTELASEMMSKLENSKVSGRKQIEHICQDQAICPSSVVVKTGPASKVIVDTAIEEKADLIVVGRTGTGGPEKSPIGSVAHKLLRTSPVPILVVKKIDGKAAISKILVPTDFGDEENIERDFAWKIARKMEASLTFLYVLELFGHDFRLTDEMFESALKKLKAKRKREHVDVEIDEAVTRAFNASDGIIDFSEQKDFDLIVMSSVVKKVPRIFLGSTTEKVIMHSRLPVLAIPPRFE